MRGRTIYLAAILIPLAVILGANRGEDQSARLQALGRARVEAARACLEVEIKLFRSGEVVSDDIYTWSRRLRESRIDLASNKAERASADAEHLERMMDLKKALEALGPKDCPPEDAARKIDYWIKEAQYWSAIDS
jgi:hypothetical protein